MHSGMSACQGSGRCLHSGEAKESVVFIQACQESGVDLQVCCLNSIRTRSPRPFISVQIIIVIRPSVSKHWVKDFSLYIYKNHLFFSFSVSLRITLILFFWCAFNIILYAAGSVMVGLHSWAKTTTTCGD